LKRLRRSIVHVHRKRDRDRAFGIHEPIAIVAIDVQVIGNDRELIAGHLEDIVVINIHKRTGILECPDGKCRRYLGAVQASRQIESVRGFSCCPSGTQNGRLFTLLPEQ
jgi:hypothetical protein